MTDYICQKLPNRKKIFSLIFVLLEKGSQTLINFSESQRHYNFLKRPYIPYGIQCSAILSLTCLLPGKGKMLIQQHFK